jgi:hypothetical protein
MTKGVLTAANDAFWRTLNTLVRGCIALDVPIAVVDHGLSKAHCEWLTKRSATVIKGSQSYERSLREIAVDHKNFNPKAPPEAWWKPLVCLESPFERTIWIDADAILLRGAEEMFAAIDSGPWLTRDWWVPSNRAAGLYESLIMAVHGKKPSNFPECVWVNSGVFGFSRGDAWLEGWRDMCQTITGNPEYLSHCRCRDQSALAAWLAANPSTAPRFIEDDRWNYPANGKMAKDAKLRTNYLPTVDLLATCKIDHPEAYVVHWLGRPKPVPEE